MENPKNLELKDEIASLAIKLNTMEAFLRSQFILNKQVLNIDEVAIYTGLSKLYIYKLTSKNDIPHFKPNGKNIYFKKEEIDNWLMRNRQSTNEEIELEAINFTINKKR
jgi:excisionase family DNA binding protein